MNIIVTGAVGIGKTTICEKVIQMANSLGYSCGGILTPKAPDKGIIIVDIKTGERKALASIYNIYQGPRIGKYFFNPDGIEFGVRAIDRGISSDVLFVDEIGYLELEGNGFVKILELIRAERAKKSVLVIRRELLPVFLSRLNSKLSIIEANIHNRNGLPQRICALLTSNLPDNSSKRA
ncbi:nucleoside-triphosphatase [Chloroflexota bacterium]